MVILCMARACSFVGVFYTDGDVQWWVIFCGIVENELPLLLHTTSVHLYITKCVSNCFEMLFVCLLLVLLWLSSFCSIFVSFFLCWRMETKTLFSVSLPMLPIYLSAFYGERVTGLLRLDCCRSSRWKGLKSEQPNWLEYFACNINIYEGNSISMIRECGAFALWDTHFKWNKVLIFRRRAMDGKEHLLLKPGIKTFSKQFEIK